MIYIDFKEPESPDWSDWREKCEVEQSKLNASIELGKPSEISNLYKELTEHFFGINSQFHGKCAYCESLIIANQSGDIDHYRPKKRVTEFRKIVNHTGYYWLTYDFNNFLPSCISCNRPKKVKIGTDIIGKWNEFPVEGVRANEPGDEINEHPLIINPTKIKDIEKHIEIKNSNCIFKAKTKEGKTTCNIFGLNKREALITERKKAYHEGLVALLLLGIAYGNNNKAEISRLETTIDGFISGIKPYSAAGRAGYYAAKKKHRPIVKYLL